MVFVKDLSSSPASAGISFMATAHSGFTFHTIHDSHLMILPVLFLCLEFSSHLCCFSRQLFKIPLLTVSGRMRPPVPVSSIAPTAVLIIISSSGSSFTTTTT